MRIFVYILAVLMTTGPLFADKGNLKGTVMDLSGKKILTGVEVTAKSDAGEFKAYTDRYGRYSIELEEGAYDVVFKYFVIVDSTVKTVDVKGGTDNWLNLELKSKVVKNNLAAETDTELSDSIVVTYMHSPYDYSSRRYDSDYKFGYGDDGDDGVHDLSYSVDDGSADTPLEVRSTSSVEKSAEEPSGRKTRDAYWEGEGKKSDKPAKTESAFMITERTGAEPPPSVLAEDMSLDDFEESVGGAGSSGDPNAAAGILTSGEVNDFRKWDMWQDIGETDLNGFRETWKFRPDRRYSVQLTNNYGMPVIDCEVQLIYGDQVIVWAARTDNTGKAELWINIFNEEYDDRNLKIKAVYSGDDYYIDDVKEFHDGVNILEIEADCNVPKNVDILFAVDATGSMGDEIEYLKEEMLDIISKVDEKYTELNINLGSVFYRDVTDDYIVKYCDLSDDISKTDAFIKNQFAAGGGDFPEAVDKAMQTAVNEITWSDNAVARIMFLILDAPPHQDPEIVDRIKELSARAAMMGIRIVPVSCSGVDKSTEYIMRSIALATNGTYVFLTDHSGVGGGHIEPTTDKYDVELLNDMFIRLIEQFTMTPACNEDAPLAGLDPDGKINNHNEAILDESNPEYADLVDRVKCYPNPTNGELNIAIGGLVDELFLVDISGKIVERYTNLSVGNQRIYMGDYATGIYYMKYRIGKIWANKQVMLIR